ncbi:hypothetical protein QBC40DRAFT_252449 [Triangularia verruculosa]|uniref:Cyanovirin-N domain-containing protein n=1 Tax=Triangularia verruculosa TaxID=2587418 RepID=A0AAN6XK62_9PEZI|nr:hypothetical protein QBC40DRAFT_252449 [Triangularia verruculosa]
MKFSTALTAGVMLLTELGGVSAEGGGFFQSCKGDWYMENQYMIAECRTKSGGWRRSRQDMNKCVTNLNGQLLAWNNGGFRATCGLCSQGGLIIDGAPKNSRLQCMCINNAGKQDYTELELSKSPALFPSRLAN